MKIIENISYSEFRECLLDIYLPSKDEFPVFIYFHGGGLEAGDKREADTMAEYLTNQGIAVVSANYRMYPTAVYPQFIQDAATAIAWTKENISKYGKPIKTYVGGSSAGAYISMMLCFNKKYLEPYGIKPTDIDGFIHDAGQPTCHFNVLREKGLDTRRVIIDDTSALYYIGTEKEYAPMCIFVSDNDMENRYEQVMLLISTMKHFKYKEPELTVMHGTHCEYISKTDETGESIFGKMIYDYMKKVLL